MSDQAPMSQQRDVFELEVVKLLLQVAWADHEVSEKETEALFARARKLGISETHIQELGTYLNGNQPLPLPNLGLLKLRRTEVMREIRQLVSDLGVGETEEGILRDIAELLG